MMQIVPASTQPTNGCPTDADRVVDPAPELTNPDESECCTRICASNGGDAETTATTQSTRIRFM